MPYIEPKRREELFDFYYGEDLTKEGMQSAGELNYMITELIKEYMADKVKNYACFNSVVGALESCKLEFYARVVRPYEDIKIKENGDVYL